VSSDAFSWLANDKIYTRRRGSGVSSVEILALPDELRQLVSQIMRQEPVRVEALVEALERPEEDVRGQVALLKAQGWLQAEEIDGQVHYRVNLARRRTRSLPPGIWQVLEGTWKVQLFRYFDEDEKADFSGAFELQHFETGQHIFEAGEWGYSMYLIDAGTVELVRQDVDGREVVLDRLKAGDIMGEFAVLLGERRWATARATERVSAWSLHKDALDRLLARSPGAGLSVRREIERGLWMKSQRGRPSAARVPGGGDEARLRRDNPVLVVGSGAIALARALAGYGVKRVLVLDVHPQPPTPVAASPKVDESSRLRDAGGAQTVEQRWVYDLDSKALAAALHQAVEQFDSVIVAAPTELHGPLMGVVGQIELVVDLSGTTVPWAIAAARRHWAVPAGGPVSIGGVARHLCHCTLGLALSGGAARALAHIGVLRALEEAQLPVDMIASTGMGAVVAGLYAAGLSVNDLIDLATRRDRDLNPFDGSLNLRLASRSALYAGKRARNALHKLLEDRTFADLRLSLYVVAADLESGQPVVFDQGPLVDAMEASLALAGLVAPAEISGSPIAALNERLLVDGSLINSVPADILSERGADLIVGVSTIPSPARQGALTAQGRVDLTSTWLRLRDQLAHTALMNNMRHLDVLITPQVDGFDGTAFDRAAELIAVGLTATQQEVEYIRALLVPDARS